MPSNVGLYPRHFHYYVRKLFKFCGEYGCFCFSRQSTLLGFRLRVQISLQWAVVSVFCFQRLFVAIPVCFMFMPLSVCDLVILYPVVELLSKNVFYALQGQTHACAGVRKQL